VLKRALTPSLLALALFATACGGSTETTTADEPVVEADAPTTTSTEAAEVSTTSEAEPEEATTTEAPEPEETDVAVDPADIDGEALYATNCARCHGGAGEGSRGPTLIGIADKIPDKALSIGTVTNGGRTMPEFGSKLTEDEIVAIVDFTYVAWPATGSE